MKLWNQGLLQQSIKCGKESGKVSLFVGMYFVLFLTVILYASLQIERFRAASLYLEDALAASNLGAATVNLREYGRTHKILVPEPDICYETYQYMLSQNLNLYGNSEPLPESLMEGRVTIASFLIYNVDEGVVTAYSFSEQGDCDMRQLPLSEAYAPNGVKIESTSIYSEVKFKVKYFPGLYVEAHKGKLVDIVGED